MWWRRKRYEVVIVGDESGRVTPLTFLRFRREAHALEWCQRQNAQHAFPTTHFEYREIGDADPADP